MYSYTHLWTENIFYLLKRDLPNASILKHQNTLYQRPKQATKIFGECEKTRNIWKEGITKEVEQKNVDNR